MMKLFIFTFIRLGQPNQTKQYIFIKYRIHLANI